MIKLIPAISRLRGLLFSEQSNKRDVGKEFEVLVEGSSKRSEEQLFGKELA